MMTFRFLSRLGLGLACLCIPLPLAAQDTPRITTVSAQAADPSASFVTALAEAAAGDPVIAGFFAARDHAAFWTGPADQARRVALFQALDGAAAHGLPVERYDAAALRAQMQAARTQGDRGRIEVALTQALLAYAHDVSSGVLDPAKVVAGIKREVARRDPALLLAELGATRTPGAWMRALPPQSAEYAQLVKARLSLTQAVAAGGWGPQVEATSLRPGDSGPAVVALRDRLVAQGYLARSAAATYDARIERAVRAFQADHGLLTTGDAAASTIAEINRDPQERLQSVLVAMERERWAARDLGQRHIWVNIPDFSAVIVEDGRAVFTTRAVMGDASPAEKQTPEFSHQMTYMELNPDWTVPSGIIRRDYLPRLQNNPNALGHLQLIDRRGRVVSRGSVDFAAYSARNFPFTLRQAPGDGNALGAVKFMFPNPYAIYLHDTPHKEHFPLETRAFSNGCIRLNEPFEFAYELLSRQEADPKAAFDEVLDRGRQERLSLRDPVPIHLEYRTAFAGPKGRMEYRRDVYGRDARLYQALVDAGVAQTATGG